MSQKQTDATELARVLTIASQLYIGGSYSNLMMAIPSAFKQWEKEYRQYQTEWATPEYEVNMAVARCRSTVNIAFQFPANFLN